MDSVRNIDIHLDLYNQNYIPLNLKQYDNTKLNFIISNNGVSANLSGNSFILNFIKGDKTLVVQTSGFDTSLLSSGKVSVTLVDDCLRAYGKGNLELLIVKDGNIISNFVIDCIIQGSVIDDTIPSSNVITLTEELNETIQDGIEAKEDLENVIATADTTTYATKGEINTVNSLLEENEKELKPKYNSANQPMIFIIDDDITSNVLTKWVPVCDAKGIKISLGAVKDFVGTSGYMTLEQLKNLRDSGYDILSHSKSHPHLYNISDADWELQCSESLQFVRENGFNDKAIVYPFGLYESGMDDTKRKNIKALTRKYYDYGIDATETTNYLPFDSMRVERVGIDGADLPEIQELIDKCFNRKNILVILTHCGFATNTDLYAPMIDYIQSLGIPIYTFEEGIKRVGNIISAGDTLSDDYLFISKSAKIKSSDIIKQQMVVVDNTLTNIDAPISTYQVGKITYCEITASADTYLNKGGHLQSYHSAVANQSYQELVVSEKFSNYSIRRRWLDSSTSWGEWQWVAGIIIGGRPTFNVKGCLCYDGAIQKLIINTGSNWRDTNGNIV